MTSEVARLKAHIQAEYEAAQQALSGAVLGTASHTFINARMENVYRAHEQLTALVGPEEARIILVQNAWKPENMGKEIV
ncbi:MAG TPA: hypothetical protein VH593_15565 [Ktedonobacteraceae bacterium]|jgi:hypothetical protein